MPPCFLLAVPRTLPSAWLSACLCDLHVICLRAPGGRRVTTTGPQPTTGPWHRGDTVAVHKFLPPSVPGLCKSRLEFNLRSRWIVLTPPRWGGGGVDSLLLPVGVDVVPRRRSRGSFFTDGPLESFSGLLSPDSLPCAPFSLLSLHSRSWGFP